MNWQFMPQTACEVKEGDQVTFSSWIRNGATVLVGINSSSNIARPSHRRKAIPHFPTNSLCLLLCLTSYITCGYTVLPTMAPLRTWPFTLPQYDRWQLTCNSVSPLTFGFDRPVSDFPEILPTWTFLWYSYVCFVADQFDSKILF